MPPVVTLKQTIDASIAAERAAEGLFRRLEAASRQAPEMAAFWARFAADEAQHAAWITALRARLDRDTLARPVENEVAALVRRSASFSVEQALAGVHDLEAAYRLVDELEHSETNALFRFLADHFVPDPKMQRFMTEQLEHHVAALVKYLPAAYRDPAQRRAVGLAFD